jgi:hypothetical protein
MAAKPSDPVLSPPAKRKANASEGVRQRLVIAACKAGAPAPSARKDRPDSTRFSYGAAAQYPDLKYLPTQLAHYAHEYLREQLGLEDLPEERRDLDSVLKNCLVPDTDRCDIFTFGCMATGWISFVVQCA